VALPMDEQRILEEMERVLAADDPRLAARLAAFGQPGFGQVLRTRRARATLSLMVLVMIAAVAAVIYLMSAFRPGGTAGSTPPTQYSSQSAVPPAPPQLSPVTHCMASYAPGCTLNGDDATTPSTQAVQPSPGK
jgi:Protein of unknown function (DUF3040)